MAAATSATAVKMVGAAATSYRGEGYGGGVKPQQPRQIDEGGHGGDGPENLVAEGGEGGDDWKLKLCQVS